MSWPNLRIGEEAASESHTQLNSRQRLLNVQTFSVNLRLDGTRVIIWPSFVEYLCKWPNPQSRRKACQCMLMITNYWSKKNLQKVLHKNWMRQERKYPHGTRTTFWEVIMTNTKQCFWEEQEKQVKTQKSIDIEGKTGRSSPKLKLLGVTLNE